MTNNMAAVLELPITENVYDCCKIRTSHKRAKL